MKRKKKEKCDFGWCTSVLFSSFYIYVGKTKIGRTKINRRKLVDTKIGRYKNWSLRKLVDANISRDLIIKEKTVLIKNVEWQFEI